MFEKNFPVPLKDFSRTFKLSERTPYVMLKNEPSIYKSIKKGRDTYIPSSAVRHYRLKKNILRYKELLDQVYSLYSRKGGVGKTCILLNLAARAVMSGYKVLLIDMDSQANLTKAFKIKDVKTRATFQDIFDDISTIEEARIEVRENLFLIPCNNKFAGLARNINPLNGFNQFKHIFDTAREDYDLVFVDNGGIMDMTVFQTLAVSDHIISPAQPDEFSEEGLELTKEEIEKLYKQGITPKHTIVMNFFRENEKASKEYYELFRDFYGESVAETTIPKSQEFVNTLNNPSAVCLYENDLTSKLVPVLDNLFNEIVEGNRVIQ